jgi:hypothetical protein
MVGGGRSRRVIFDNPKRREINMREISSGNPHTKIHIGDEPGQGGACHEYYISRQTLAKTRLLVSMGTSNSKTAR